MCCFTWETQKNVFLSHSRLCLEFFEFSTREKSTCVRYLKREDINSWQRAKRERGFESARRVTRFLFWDLSLSLFFLCLRTIKFFSCCSQKRSSSSLCRRRSEKKRYSCVFLLGDFSTCGVHVREGFCEKGVYFNLKNISNSEESIPGVWAWFIFLSCSEFLLASLPITVKFRTESALVYYVRRQKDRH